MIFEEFELTSLMLLGFFPGGFPRWKAADSY
jgi:hypothetical protein